MNGNTGHTSRILIVEDVQETRDSIKELLKSDGYQVDAVPDEDEAQDKIERNPPDLILHYMHRPTSRYSPRAAWSTRLLQLRSRQRSGMAV